MPNEWSNVACINCPIQTQSVKLSTQQHEQAYKMFFRGWRTSFQSIKASEFVLK